MAQQGPGDRLRTPQLPRRVALSLAGLCAVLAVVGPSDAVPGTTPDSAEPAATAPTELTLTPSPPTATPAPATPTPGRLPTTAPAQPAPLHVVAPGDFVTDGTNCGCVPFPQLYAAGLRDRYGDPVHVTNDGMSGATSADVLDELASDTTEVSTADVVVVTIGANDFSDVSDQVLSTSCGGNDELACTTSRLRQLQHNLRGIVASIKALDETRSATVLLTGYWNVYEDGNVAEADYSKAGRAASVALTRHVNQVVKAAADDTGATYVDLFAPFKGAAGDQDATPLLADDGDHPSAAGHRVIAHTLLAVALPAHSH